MRTTFLRHAVRAITVLTTVSSLGWGQVTAADRRSKPLFPGEQSEPRVPEIAYEPNTHTVTLKLSVQDVNGFFVPNLRRNNFAVFEDGARQRNVTVEVEHAPITLAVLMEIGGRSQQLNKTLASDVPYLARGVLDVLGRNDKLALFTYDDRLHPIFDFNAPHSKWDDAFRASREPEFSEANFYDAAIQVLEQLASMPGRKALLLLSTGIDTFSHATLDDLVNKAETTRTPVYVIDLGDMARRAVMERTTGPLARVDWETCRRQLERLARVSGGRAYGGANSLSVPSIYDDIMENVRVRYVITYVSSQPETVGKARTVQVKLIDQQTEAPRRITDASGRRVAARVIAEASYTPAAGESDQGP